MKTLEKDPCKLFSDKFRTLYKVDSSLGFGSYGGVYKGVQPGLDRPVAIKALVLESRNEEAERRFEQEARLAARVEHENVVAVYGSGKDQDFPYIIYEYVEGQSLDKLLGNKRLTLIEVLGLIRRVALGLFSIHKASIVHRDIKPENILVDNKGQARITDLGIAKDGWENGVKTKTGMVLGTPAYMAPEYLVDGKVSSAIDVYSLGVVFYECVSGQKPFTGNIMEIVDSHLKKKPKVLSTSIPQSVSKLIFEMMNKDPLRRPHCQQVAMEIETLLETLAKDEHPSRVVTAQKEQPKQRSTFSRYLPIVFLFLIVTVIFINRFLLNEKKPAVTHVEYVAPLSASESHFSSCLKQIRQSRSKLSQEQSDWLLYAVRHGVDLGEEKLLKIVSVVGLLPLSQETTIIKCHLAAALVHKNTSFGPKLSSLAFKMMNKLEGQNHSPLIKDLCIATSFVVAEAILEHRILEKSKHQRLKIKNGKRLPFIQKALNSKKLRGLSVWEKCLFAKASICYGCHNIGNSRDTFIYPAINILNEHLRDAKDINLANYLKEHLIALYLSYVVLTQKIAAPSQIPTAKKKTLQYADELEASAKDEHKLAWLRMQRGIILHAFNEPINAIKHFLSIDKKFPKDCKKHFWSHLLEYYLNIIIDLTRRNTISQRDKTWAAQVGIQKAREYQEYTQGRVRTINYHKVAELHLFLNELDKAAIQYKLSIKNSSALTEDLTHKAHERLFALRNGFNPIRQKRTMPDWFKER